jgi:hypothetical protein
MPTKPRAPRTAKAKVRPWRNASAARRAVLGICLKEFRELFGTSVPAGWRAAWLKRFDEVSTIETDARKAAQDFARYPVPTAKARTVRMLQQHGADPTAKPWSLEVLQKLPPVAAELFMYIVSDPEEPFVLNGEAGIQRKPGTARAPWQDIKQLRVINDDTAEILDHKGQRHIVKYQAVHLRTGVKWERREEHGPLPDVTKLDGFIIANFEQLAYDAGPEQPFSMRADGARKYGTFFAWDRELAMLSAILGPCDVSVMPRDISEGTSASVLLDKHRHKLTNLRKRVGYLEVTADAQIRAERMYQQPSSQKPNAKVTSAERQAWLSTQMYRPPKTPVVPWPSRRQ